MALHRLGNLSTLNSNHVLPSSPIEKPDTARKGDPSKRSRKERKIEAPKFKRIRVIVLLAHANSTNEALSYDTKVNDLVPI